RERGGAGDALGERWQLARDARDGGGEPAIVVARGDDATAGAYAGKVLMEEHADLLLEGMALAGYAIGAGHGVIVAPARYPRSGPTLEWAAAVARRAGLLGRAVLGSDFSFEVTVVQRPTAALQATASVVHGVETLCNIPVLARRGAAHYAQLSPDSATAGTKFVSFNERFARPGVYEVQFGTTLRELCDELAGGLRDGHELQALLIDGAILPPSLLDTRLDYDALEAAGCPLGHGGLVACDETTDMGTLAELLRLRA
ncbi:MAG: NADH-quinone oxidoreductase subunit, partial [Solirubrobacteraceae bacterium]|nr:NADH-quinone oxidoreductase subunit [Solirubrobacteraceae bacterium]